MSAAAYLRLVAVGALIGVPAAALAAVFLAFVHDLEHWLWHDLPDAIGVTSPPWYLVIGLPVAGACVVFVARRFLPGDGGHDPLKARRRRRFPSRMGLASRSPPSARSPSARCSARRRR